MAFGLPAYKNGLKQVAERFRPWVNMASKIYTMKRIISSSIFAFLVLPVIVAAQGYTIEKVELGPAFSKELSISGVAYSQGKLYMAAERPCQDGYRMYEVMPGNSDGGRKKWIHGLENETLEIEGVTYLDGNWYIISETRVGLFRLQKKDEVWSAAEINIPNKDELGAMDGEHGLEGIAINKKSSQLYLLFERRKNAKTGNYYSVIYRYTISWDIASEAINAITFVDSYHIDLEDEFSRYCDIYYDDGERRLVCIKSYFKPKDIKKNNRDTGRYSIKGFSMDSIGKIIDPLHPVDLVPVQSLTDSVSAYCSNNKYSSNLEGITMDENGSIYLVSDNKLGIINCCADAEKGGTLLLKLTPVKANKQPTSEPAKSMTGKERKGRTKGHKPAGDR